MPSSHLDGIFVFWGGFFCKSLISHQKPREICRFFVPLGPRLRFFTIFRQKKTDSRRIGTLLTHFSAVFGVKFGGFLSERGEILAQK
jgi:hypothetical protein